MVNFVTSGTLDPAPHRGCPDSSGLAGRPACWWNRCVSGDSLLNTELHQALLTSKEDMDMYKMGCSLWIPICLILRSRRLHGSTGFLVVKGLSKPSKTTIMIMMWAAMARLKRSWGWKCALEKQKSSKNCVQHLWLLLSTWQTELSPGFLHYPPSVSVVGGLVGQKD